MGVSKNLFNLIREKEEYYERFQDKSISLWEDNGYQRSREDRAILLSRMVKGADIRKKKEVR